MMDSEPNQRENPCLCTGEYKAVFLFIRFSFSFSFLAALPSRCSSPTYNPTITMSSNLRSQQPDLEQGPGFRHDDRGIYFNKEARFKYAALLWGAWAMLFGILFQKLHSNLLAIVGGGVVVVLAVPFGWSAGFLAWSGFSRTKLPFTQHLSGIETTIFWFLVQVVLFLYVAAFATGAMFENMGDYLSQFLKIKQLGDT
ncbi:hypothetical protein FN846DRAFT_954882 [Sphaerosporella brunnea]|uniref:Uncharacterized protein n=1 Tax=Sphaerosporella brunnea TaxID=1250544 RepID=A0A5J5ETN5_9PEZI|nr:hypothetical protein FN846DRAFT_954882 [Sphaerosporella brunnea]